MNKLFRKKSKDVTNNRAYIDMTPRRQTSIQDIIKVKLNIGIGKGILTTNK